MAAVGKERVQLDRHKANSVNHSSVCQRGSWLDVSKRLLPCWPCFCLLPCFWSRLDAFTQRHVTIWHNAINARLNVFVGYVAVACGEAHFFTGLFDVVVAGWLPDHLCHPAPWDPTRGEIAWIAISSSPLVWLSPFYTCSYTVLVVPLNQMVWHLELVAECLYAGHYDTSMLNVHWLSSPVTPK